VEAREASRAGRASSGSGAPREALERAGATRPYLHSKATWSALDLPTHWLSARLHRILAQRSRPRPARPSLGLRHGHPARRLLGVTDAGKRCYGPVRSCSVVPRGAIWHRLIRPPAHPRRRCSSTAGRAATGVSAPAPAGSLAVRTPRRAGREADLTTRTPLARPEVRKRARPVRSPDVTRARRRALRVRVARC